jgi:choline dehydrogenase-like flavoprotein
METFDFVIIGAVSAGCVLANRLSSGGKYSVCLLEADERDLNPFIHNLAGFMKTRVDLNVNWSMPRSRTTVPADTPSHSRAARPSAVPAQSTAWPTTMGNVSISTAGRNAAIEVGGMPTCCLSFAAVNGDSVMVMTFSVAAKAG